MKLSVLNSILGFVLILLTNMSWAGQTMTLEQCLQFGMEKNPSLEASRFKVDASGYDIKSARAGFLPSVSTSLSYNPIRSIEQKGGTDSDYIDKNVRSFNVRLTQMLYAGSRIFNTYERAKILEQLAKTELDLASLELAYNIESIFYKLMKAKQDVLTATESVNRLTESVHVAEAFLKRELVPQVNVLRARVDLADAMDLLGVAKNDVNRERVILFSLMDQAADPGVEFSGGLNHLLTEKPTFEASLKYAFDHRPDIKSLAYQLEIADKDAKIAMGKYLPTVEFDIGYYDRNDDFDRESSVIRDRTNIYWSTGITASWAFFDGGRAWYEKEKFNTEAKKVMSLIRNAKNMISTGIHNALYSMSEAEQRIKSSVDALAAAKEYYEGEDNRLKAGISTIPSLLDAQDRLLRAQANETRAVLDYQLAVSELKLFTGEKNID